METNTKFSGGRNIALKVPPHQYDQMIQFYRDILGLRELTDHAPSAGFEFGTNSHRIDTEGKFTHLYDPEGNRVEL